MNDIESRIRAHFQRPTRPWERGRPNELMMAAIFAAVRDHGQEGKVLTADEAMNAACALNIAQATLWAYVGSIEGRSGMEARMAPMCSDLRAYAEEYRCETGVTDAVARGFFEQRLLGVRYCRECGCTDNDACSTENGPCEWIEDDLCSGCAPQRAED